eukprot:838500-Amphidinium_carterae.1
MGRPGRGGLYPNPQVHSGLTLGGNDRCFDSTLQHAVDSVAETLSHVSPVQCNPVFSPRLP